MFERSKNTLLVCRDVIRRRNELFKKLIRHPFFPLLFIGETIKTQTIILANGGVILGPVVFWLAVISIIVTIIWIFAEHLLDEAKETLEDTMEE